MEILQGEIGGNILLADFQNKESVLINSPGGSLYEGLAMYDFVLGSNMEVGVIGVAASAATLPVIASSKSWGTPNSRYLIHNPWNMKIGDAETLQKTATDLKKEQERTLELYFKHLNGTKEELQALMDAERILDANEALKLGLIKEIKNFNEETGQVEGSDIKSMFNKFKMKFEMKDDEVKKELSGIKSVLDTLTDSVKSLFKSPKNILVQDVNGVEIDFPDIETVEQITEGSNATVDGSPANGDYVLPEGQTYVFESGSLTEIKEPVTEDVAAIKQENEDLAVENQLLKEDIQNKAKELDKIKLQVADVTTKFNDFQNKFSGEKPEINVPVTEEKKESKKLTFNFNKKNN